MADEMREKVKRVIKGLNQCMMSRNKDEFETQCADCPYFNPDVTVEKCMEPLREEALQVIEDMQERIAIMSEGDDNKLNHHEVACIIADLFGDPCACNFNDIDEWLPQHCDFTNTCCPNPVGVACWEQYLKHLDKMPAKDGDPG